MSTDSLKPAEPSAPEVQSGWDPFTVWRERVHKPRAKAREARPLPREERSFAVLNPVKQDS